MADINDYITAYQREKKARKRAEALMQEKTHELNQKNEELHEANDRILAHQQKLVENEKLVAIGVLSAGVAHEINNPLAFIISNLDTLHQYYALFSKALIKLESDYYPPHVNQLFENVAREENLPGYDLRYIINDSQLIFDEVEEGLTRVKDIVSNLNSFSRSKAADRSSANINEAITSALKLVNNEIKHKCKVSIELGELEPVYCNINEVSQVFINLIMNALQALKEFGNIDIESYQKEGNIFVNVTDNGSGIPEEDLDQIFVPFFTSKPMGSGTGLGLSVSYGIIHNLGGDIQVASKQGVGTTFTIRIPVEQRAAKYQDE